MQILRFRRVAAPAFLSQSAILLSAALLIGCGGGNDAPPASIGSNASPTVDQPVAEKSPAVTEPVQLTASSPSTFTPAPTQPVAPPQTELENPFPEVVIKTSLGSIRLRLNAEKAPLTVENFLLSYVDRGFYNDTIFHYVDNGLMILGGGYDASLNAKETGPYVLSEAANGLKNKRGTIAMSRKPDHPDTAAAEFFINLTDNRFLDHSDPQDPAKYGYCVFGEVIEGMDVVDKIGNVEVTDKDQFSKTPVTPVVIEAIERVQ